ncbi:spore coat protein U domain-containing protein [Sinorhizobium meliloti]|uniref:spore coat protein U domain-containing protein n=2 Tax=Rhizobium meliloti TaxID=382 RepID=UPI0002A56133|nr:spore coat protein U domain-containing protein [Sinorhizobium meliloti]AGA09920.1 P pilus assembly protein, porin PapC [Sinorhizobium meliloti GR4]
MLLGSSFAMAQEDAADITDVSLTVANDRDLFLEVFINEVSTKLIGNFKELPDGGLAATAEELLEVGLKPDDTARADNGLIRLDRLPDVRYEVNQPEQKLFVTTDTIAARSAKVIDLDQNRKKERLKPQSGYGAVVNYTLFASSNTLFEDETDLFRGVSGSFDARLFGPLGTLSHSFLAGYSEGRFDEFTRLNSTWSYSDPERLLTYRAGDFISGGLSWTRPVYLGGLQVERNFALRSDLVTLPLPAFSGTAAVPSTLEVYTQNVRTYAGDVAAGPFEVANLPVFTGAGEARVVLRDSLGRETVTTMPYYVSSMMLGKGLLDFSAEVGFPRRNFGIESQDYDERLMGVFTARYGMADWLTVEGHAEGGEDLINAGLGLAFPLGPFGAASVAVAGSRASGGTGTLFNAALELSYNDWSLYARLQRTFGNYQDIASITAEPTFSGPDGIPYPARAPAFALTLGALGTGSGTATIYGTVMGGQSTAAPGSYLSTFSAADVEIRYRYTTTSSCTTAVGSIARPSLNVTASVAANCMVATQNVDFGTTGVLSSNIDATGQATVTCTPATAYTVSLSNGMSGTSPTNRRMTLGSAAVVYGLYKDAGRSQPWGDAATAGSTVAGTGTGAAQGYTVYGRVPPQTTPTPGTYSDTVVVTVTY